MLLASRLARTNRRAVHESGGRVTLLEDRGAPSLLGYALACSIAWHTRRPVLTLVLSDRPHPALEQLATVGVESALRSRPPVERGTMDARADLMLATATGAFAPHALAGTVDDLCAAYDHVLLQYDGAPPPLKAIRSVRLVSTDGDVGVAPRAGHSVRAWTGGRTEPWPDRQGVLAVPALEGVEEAALSDGLLPSSCAAGRAIGWLARDIAGLKVGLALGAGAVKGYAHIGVLRTLAQRGVPVDVIAGTSIGAAVAALHACGADPEDAARRLDEVGSAAFRPTVPTNALLSSAGLRDGLRRVAGERRFEDVSLPLAVVAADIVTHREVVFRHGPLWRAVLAIMSIPGIYPPQRMGPAVLVDGGILNPVPASVVAEMGADVVIAVKLGAPPAQALPEGARPAGPTTVLQAIARTIEVMQTKITAYTTATATVLIEPAFAPGEGWGLRNFSLGRRYIPLGEEAARQSLPRIAAVLPWVR